MEDDTQSRRPIGSSKQSLPQRPKEDALPIGTMVGAYQIEQLLGGGGGGVVYAVRHTLLGSRAALKLIRSEVAQYPVMVSRFLLEATAVNRIGHPNIVDIYEFGEAGPGRPFYVMELLEGVDLRKYLQLHGRFTPAEALELIGPVCEAVQAAHEAGFVHRDIKANNIVVVESEGTRKVKLVDFGVAKMFQVEEAGAGLTEPGVQLGTVHNMAPEQIRCEKVDARTDVYALGVLTYQLLTGQFPFQAQEPRQVALMHLQVEPPKVSTLAPVSPAVDAAVSRCMQKRPDLRFASAADFLAALRAAVGDVKPPAPERKSFAVGVYFEVSTPGETEMTDSMLDDVIRVLDEVEDGLLARGFSFPLRASGALLGVRLVADEQVEVEQQRAKAAVEALLADLETRADRHPGVVVSGHVSAEQALYRASDDGVEVVGGPIFEVDSWTQHKGRVCEG